MKTLSTIALALSIAIALPAAAGEVRVSKKTAPEYPAEALRAGTEGYVDVEVSLAAGGAVQQVSVVNAKPARVFERSAVSSVKKWQFDAPAGGKTKVRVDFKN